MHIRVIVPLREVLCSCYPFIKKILIIIRQSNPDRVRRWQEFRMHYPSGGSKPVHPLRRKNRGNGAMRRPIMMCWHRYVHLALCHAVSRSWLIMAGASTNLFALTESILVDWLHAHAGLIPIDFLEENSGFIPEATW